MAQRLLARVDGHIAAKRIERFFGDPQCPPVAGGADDARTGEAIDDPLQRVIDCRGSRDLVANQASFRRVAVETATIKDGLASDAIAGAGMMPSLRAGSVI